MGCLGAEGPVRVPDISSDRNVVSPGHLQARRRAPAGGARGALVLAGRGAGLEALWFDLVPAAEGAHRQPLRLSPRPSLLSLAGRLYDGPTGVGGPRPGGARRARKHALRAGRDPHPRVSPGLAPRALWDLGRRQLHASLGLTGERREGDAAL